VNIGAYAPGVNAEYDLAVQARPKVIEYLQQDSGAPSTFEQSKKRLADLTAWIEAAEKIIRVQAAQKAAPRK
jgi:flagellar biosynthesis/type III secretory pathway ATPase